MSPLAGLALGCAAIGGGYQLFQLFAAWRFFRRARRAASRWPATKLPPVTVLKPLKGPGIDLYENLASFCRQDYPAACQIVFGVEDPADPAVAVVQRIKRDFPGLDIVLAVGRLGGTNRKVANLCQMMRHARHDILVMSDSDIRVRRDYLRSMVAPLAQDPEVGLTTCLYRGRAPLGFPSVVESLFINTDFTPMVLAAQLVQRFEYAYGASIAVRRQALDEIGGFAPIADHLADDYQLGNRVAKRGWQLVLLPYVVETVLDSVTLADVWRHQLRWARTCRVCQPVGWFFAILTHATTFGVLAALGLGGALGWSVLGILLALRLGTLYAVLGMLGDHAGRRRLWLVPPKDLVSTAVWLGAWTGRRVEWSGHRLRVLPDGRMVPIESTGAAGAETIAEPEPLRAAER
jgi:ceramide glucosyltransferase